MKPLLVVLGDLGWAFGFEPALEPKVKRQLCKYRMFVRLGLCEGAVLVLMHLPQEILIRDHFRITHLQLASEAGKLPRNDTFLEFTDRGETFISFGNILCTLKQMDRGCAKANERIAKSHCHKCKFIVSANLKSNTNFDKRRDVTLLRSQIDKPVFRKSLDHHGD